MKPIYRLNGIEIDAIVRSAMARVPDPCRVTLQSYYGRKVARLIELLTDKDLDISGDDIEVKRCDVRVAMEHICQQYPIEPGWLPGGFAQQLTEDVMRRLLSFLQDVVLEYLR